MSGAKGGWVSAPHPSGCSWCVVSSSDCHAWKGTQAKEDVSIEEFLERWRNTTVYHVHKMDEGSGIFNLEKRVCSTLEMRCNSCLSCVSCGNRTECAPCCLSETVRCQHLLGPVTWKPCSAVEEAWVEPHRPVMPCLVSHVSAWASHRVELKILWGDESTAVHRCLTLSGGFVQGSISVNRLCINIRRNFQHTGWSQQMKAFSGSELAVTGGV